MKKKKGPETINIRVFKEDWKLLKEMATVDKRTLQDTFGISVKLAHKMRA